MVLTVLLSCAGSDPVTPAGTPEVSNQSILTAADSPGTLLGLWKIVIDQQTLEYEVIPERFSTFHVNVRQFLEESPCKNCLALEPPIIVQPYGMDVSIGIEHPFPGLSKYIGFDVRGIVMLQGQYNFPGFNQTSTRVAAGDWGLRNPDGYTDAFNKYWVLPGILGYSTGKLSNPDWGLPVNTLNAFKAYYSDGQSEDDGGRRAFLNGDYVSRTFEIQTHPLEQLVFWYAVDASWQEPPDVNPVTVDDFPVSANCPEAFRFNFSVVSGELYPDSGEVSIGVEAWDHQGWTSTDLAFEAPECFDGKSDTVTASEINGNKARWIINVPNIKGGLSIDDEVELLVGVTNFDDDEFNAKIDGFGRFTIPVVEPTNDCNDALHSIAMGKGDFGGGTNMSAPDAAFVHDTGSASDGYFMGYLSGFAGTVCTTYNVDSTSGSDGPGLAGKWGNPYISSWPVPFSIDISEEQGLFFVVWDLFKSNVEVWTWDQPNDPPPLVIDASNTGDIRGLDTDGSGGWWNAYFPEFGFAQGVKHFIPDGGGGYIEDSDNGFQLPEAWGTVYEVICIPSENRLLILGGIDNGKLRSYDTSTTPPTYIEDLTGIFSGPLEFVTFGVDKPCDMDIDWSDPDMAKCRIVVWGNLASGNGELVKIDSDLNVLAGPIAVNQGYYNSIAINPEEHTVTLWPKRGAGGGEYTLVETPAGW
jgi:hypothetical protein